MATTVFTAHATALGHNLCNRGFDLYCVIETLDAVSEASKSPVYHSYVIESLAA